MYAGWLHRAPRVATAVLVAGALGSSLTGCDGGAAAADDGKLTIVASFYPLQWLAEQIGGDVVTVTSLTKPGAEPHDLELAPSDVARVADADLVAYLSGFQPAVDDAVDREARHTSFDAAQAADLDLTYTPIEDGEEQHDAEGAVDPHFWLDPQRLSAVAAALTQRMSEQDTKDAAAFSANLATLQGELADLDHDFAEALQSCQNRDLVTSHNAFGYLAGRYGLTQVGITGLTAEGEPSPSDLAEVTEFVRDHDVHTIYYETLVSPAIAETVARETGAKTAVLDPIEGLTDDSPGHDYLDVMRANLANLVAGQPCL